MARRSIWMSLALSLAGCASSNGSEGDGTTTDGTPATETTAATPDDDDDDDTAGSDDADTTAGDDDDDDDDSTGDDDDSAGDDDDSTGDDDDDGTTTGGDDANVLHVSELGQDSNPGTSDEPMRTIQWAIAQAGGSSDVDTIRVAGGTYEADVANDDAVVLVDGVSLFGGWSPDFGDRDPATWPSAIVDTSQQEPQSGNENDPAGLIEIPEGVGSGTVLDGFRVEVGLGDFVTGVLIAGDAAVTGNLFVRGQGSQAVSAAAITIDGGSPYVAANRVDFDYQSMASTLRAIHCLSTDATIVNNVMGLRGAASSTHALSLYGGAPQIIGNSVAIADSSNQWIFRMEFDPTPLIDNNVLQTSSAGGVCVGSLSNKAVPTGLHNNLLQCTYTTWGNGLSPVGTYETIAPVHASVENASGNVKLAGPLVDADSDLMLDDGAPCTVARGGLDVSATYPEDFAGEERTDPLSIGAHEWDGDCQ